MTILLFVNEKLCLSPVVGLADNHRRNPSLVWRKWDLHGRMPRSRTRDRVSRGAGFGPADPYKTAAHTRWRRALIERTKLIHAKMSTSRRRRAMGRLHAGVSEPLKMSAELFEQFTFQHLARNNARQKGGEDEHV